MSVEVTIEDRASGKVAALIGACGDVGRSHLHTVAANALASQIQRHIAFYALRKHGTALTLGGTPTGHYEKGAAAITSDATAAGGTVHIPIPGIQRAWKDIAITTPTKNGKKFLTIPKSGKSYGHKVSEMEAMGWKVFRPKGKSILLGELNGETEVLYVLAKKVRQPKDPSLLPSNEEMAATASDSVVKEVFRIIRKSRGAA